MEYVRTKDILDKAKTFHSNLSDFFLLESGHLDNELVRMVLNYFAKHERMLADEIQRFEDHADPTLIETWFKYAPETLQELMDASVEIPVDATVDDVVIIALNMDDKLIDFYRTVASSALSTQVRELFENLLEQESMEERVLVRSALRDF
jgi:rubrerythrin